MAEDAQLMINLTQLCGWLLFFWLLYLTLWPLFCLLLQTME